MVQRLVAYNLRDGCRHQGPIDVSKFPDIEVPSFSKKVVCAKCGAPGPLIDVRPNWKEQPVMPTSFRLRVKGKFSNARPRDHFTRFTGCSGSIGQPSRSISGALLTRFPRGGVVSHVC
jgi:hypothetical protein